MTRTESDVRAELFELFPEIRMDLEDQYTMGRIHCEISSLARLTHSAINLGHRKVCERAFAFADRSLRFGTSSVKNAIAVSFLEQLTFNDKKKRRRSWAFEMMTPLLQQEFRAVMTCWDTLKKQKE